MLESLKEMLEKTKCFKKKAKVTEKIVLKL